MTVTITYEPDLHVPDKDGRMQPKGPRLCLQTPFSMKDRVKGLPGALWAPKPQGFWHVPATVESAGAVQRMLEQFETAARMHPHALELMARAEQSAAAQAHKTATDLPEIPGRYCTCPQGPKLTDENGYDTQGMCDRCNSSVGTWQHQKQGYHWAFPREGAGLIMDMGTGKSKVAAALADGWEGRNVIIVAPPRAVKVWPKQFRLHAQHKWTVINHGGLNRRGRPRFKASMRQRIDAAEHAYAQARALNQPFALVVNYEAAWQEPLRTYLLSTLPKRFPSGKWDLGVADEGHKIKAPGGKWSKFMEQLAHKCERRLLLTGTMMPHDELDVYAQARFVDPGVFGTSYSKFKTRYFKWGGYEGHQLDRSDGHPYVDEAMRREFEGKLASMTFVVESDDVLDLPPQMHQPPIVFALGDRARRHYTELLNEWKTQLGDIDVDEMLETPNVLSQMTRLAQVCSGYLPVPDPYDTKPKRLETIGTEKITAFEDWLEDVPADEKVVVFARFTQDLENIGRVAERLGRRYGEISGRRTDGLTDDATYPDDKNLIGVQLQAGGVGIDLSAARYACYYSLNFNLGDFDQSVKRLHRPGQRHPVAYYYLCAEGTIDQVILHALRQRASVIRGVLRAIKTGDVDPEGWDE